jgi:3,4-dihydroxy 2-butanone 4-phosphate synthase
MIDTIKQALNDLKSGKFILVYDSDDREGETDFFIASEFVTPNSIRTMRKDGGGLIFLMISYEIAKTFHLPFLSDLYTHIEKDYPVLQKLIANDIPYDTKSSFSLYINHRKTFTGITDNDRSLTIKRFAEIAKEKNKNNSPLDILGKEFRSPGHVPICVASEKPLSNRFGHTELSVALLTMAGLNPVASGCEIMGDNGKALSKTETKKYAKDHGLCFLEGKEIIEAWNTWSK